MTISQFYSEVINYNGWYFNILIQCINGKRMSIPMVVINLGLHPSVLIILRGCNNPPSENMVGENPQENTG